MSAPIAGWTCFNCRRPEAAWSIWPGRTRREGWIQCECGNKESVGAAEQRVDDERDYADETAADELRRIRLGHRFPPGSTARP